MGNRRRSERYRVQVPVWLKDAQGGERAHTADVSAHGIAVIATKMRALRQYVELELTLPAPAQKISVTAIVARIIEDFELDDGSKHRGLGLDFFLFDAKAKVEWQRFMLRLHTEQKKNADAIEASSLDGTVEEDAIDEPEDDGLPTFIIKPRDLGRLWAFYRGEMSKGLVRIETPIGKEVGDPVELLVVHPSSEAEWTLPGKVARSIEHGRGGRPVLEIALSSVDQNARTAFRNFVATGHGMIEEDVSISSDLAVPEDVAVRQALEAAAAVRVTEPPPAEDQRDVDTADLPTSAKSIIIDLDAAISDAARANTDEPLAPMVLDAPTETGPEPLLQRMPSESLFKPLEPSNDESAPMGREDEAMFEEWLEPTDEPDALEPAGIAAAPPPPPPPREDDAEADLRDAFSDSSSAEVEAYHESEELPTPAPPSVSPEKLSGRLFASFFFEAAQSQPPARTLQPAPRSDPPPSAPPDGGSRAGETGAPVDASRSRPLVRAPKLEAKPSGQSGPPPLPPQDPMHVVRGAPLPETIARTGTRPAHGEFAPYVGPADGEQQIKRPNGGGPSAPAPRRVSARASVEESTRTPHRDLSTEGNDPSLDRDIALAKARVVRSPNSVTACYRLSTLLMRRGGSTEEALETLRKLIQLEPNHPGAHHAIAEVLARRGEYLQAAEHLGRARRLGYRIDPRLEREIAEGRRT